MLLKNNDFILLHSEIRLVAPDSAIIVGFSKCSVFYSFGHVLF